MSSDVRLNLARKWRAKVFDHIIGQDLTIRILKNSLYVGNYFPVYLFWGQRGSGKTSTARVFAAALNCEMLDTFRDDPQKSPFPCLHCPSCKAMMAGKHPDFIEMDAASHTGVDNVRQIIDAASLMPLLGRKKIYLIDEAHMLSKAAFNAFLKILEEPPASVLFILATTDPGKIIDTVKSRCFQLFFKPVAMRPLHEHLKKVCGDEDIAYESEALTMIIQETSGSVRDALNLLEQVRFAQGTISKIGIEQVLGHIDDERLLRLFEIILYHGTTKLLPFLEKLNIRLYSAEYIWGRLILLIRAAIWLKHDIEPQNYHEQIAHLRTLIQKISLAKLAKLLDRFYKQERLFLKTTDKHLFLEILLLQACQRNDTPTNSNTTPASPLPPPVQEDEENDEYEYSEEEEEEDDENDDEEIDDAKTVNSCAHGAVGSLWNDFLVAIKQCDDPLLNSIFKQGQFSEFDSSNATVTVAFSKEFVFFKEWLDTTKKVWNPLLQKIFGESVIFNPLFTLEGEVIHNQCQQDIHAQKPAENVACNMAACNMDVASSQNNVKISMPRPQKNIQQSYARVKRKIIDVSDAQYWQKSNLLLRYFPGVVSECL